MHLDASVVYRCFNPASSLSKQAIRTSVVHHSEVESLTVQPQIVVCHRPRYGKALNSVFSKFSGSRMVADYDDLLFCTESLETHPAHLSGRASVSSLLNSARQYYAAAQGFDEFIVSTIPLQQQIRKLFPSALCHVLANGWSPEWRSFGQLAVKNVHIENRKICYFAGTANHDQDLYQINEELREFLQQNPLISLEVYGSIDLDRFIGVESQVNKGTPVPFYLLPSIIKQAWVSIAPLINSPFNYCKSAIKFIEAGIFNVPLLASRTADLERMENDGLLFADSDGQWLSGLNQLKDEKRYSFAQIACNKTALQQSSDYALQHSGLISAWFK